MTGDAFLLAAPALCFLAWGAASLHGIYIETQKAASLLARLVEALEQAATYPDQDEVD